MKNHSGVHKFFGATKKSKKGKVRSLSSVGKALSSCKMGCNVSETEREEKAHEPPPSSSSASVIAKNFLNGCNGVHNASVPRKLRSAMKKRSHESMLLGSEKVNHKMNGIIESPKKGVYGHITKDEEEVAETLYAMAAMFPENCMNGDIKELDRLSFTEKKTVLEDLKDSNVNATFEALGTVQHASHSCAEKSTTEATKFSSTHETIAQEKLELPERVEFVMGSHSNKGSSHHDPELCLVMGLNVPRQLQISHIERKHVEFEMGKNVDCKQEQHMLKVQKENEEGLALWPGLSPVASNSHAHVKSLATKALDGLEAAISASKHDLMESCYSSGKIHEVVNHKRPWKRCATHVHISHIIHNLEFPKRRVIENEFKKMRTHEGSKLGVLTEVPKMNVIRSGVTSTHGSGQFIATVKNLHESKNYILQKQCHYGPQNQNFNFLSLSSGSNGLKVGNSYDKIGTRLEALSKLQVPYFQPSFTQHDHGLMSVPTPQSQYSSTSYLDHLSVPGPQQIRLHQPQYYGNPSCGTHHNNSTVINKQQQQSFWTVQLQGRSAMNSNIMKTSFPSWKNGRHDYVASPCAQVIDPRSHASTIEAMGSKIGSISVQQQQLIASIQEKWARPSSSFCM